MGSLRRGVLTFRCPALPALLILQCSLPSVVAFAPPGLILKHVRELLFRPLDRGVRMSSTSGEPEKKMSGVLLRYGLRGQHVAFSSGPEDSKFIALHIGGLTDGLLPCPYTLKMCERLHQMGWRVVQPLLSSSHNGYGTGSLQQDSDELDMVIKHVSKSYQDACPQFVIVGHSTGSQDAVWHAKNGKERHRLCGIVLQGCVSDRDYLETLPTTPALVAQARALLEVGTPDAILPAEADYCESGAPMSAQRFSPIGCALHLVASKCFLSLATKGGPDDMFSNDLRPAELQTLFAAVEVPCLVAYSMQDEYVPETVDKAALAQRLASAFPDGQCLLVEQGDHALGTGAEQFIDALAGFLHQLQGK